MSTQNISTYSFEQLDTSIEAERSPGDVLASAWSQAEQIRERARAEGEAAGYAAGLEQARAEFSELAESLTRALGDAASQLAASRDELVETLTHQAGEISLAVAAQIVAGAFEFQPDLVIDVTRGAIRRLAERHRLSVLVNPEDLDRLTDAIERLRGEMGGIEFMDVQADRRVEPGGAIVQTEYGEIDATIATQIENARKLVAASLVGDARQQTDESSGPEDAV